MRTAEWINIVAFSSLTLLACARRLDAPRRRRAIQLGVTGLALTLVSAIAVPRALRTLPASAVRDWFPYPLLLLFYWLHAAERSGGTPPGIPG